MSLQACLYDSFLMLLLLAKCGDCRIWLLSCYLWLTSWPIAWRADDVCRTAGH